MADEGPVRFFEINVPGGLWRAVDVTRMQERTWGGTVGVIEQPGLEISTGTTRCAVTKAGQPACRQKPAGTGLTVGGALP